MSMSSTLTWNEFRKEMKGKGYALKELSKLYRMQKKKIVAEPSQLHKKSSCFSLDINDIEYKENTFYNTKTGETFNIDDNSTLIGEGAYGQVRLLEGGKLVAKTGDLEEDILAIQKLHNANISCYYPAKVFENKIVLMPTAKGGDLSEFFLSKIKSVSQKKKLRIAMRCILRMVENVNCLLQKGMYYYDLKPENILVPNDCRSDMCQEYNPECILGLGDHGSITWFGKERTGDIFGLATICPPKNDRYIPDAGNIFITRHNSVAAKKILHKIVCANILLILSLTKGKEMYSKMFGVVNYQSEKDPSKYLSQILPKNMVKSSLGQILQEEMKEWGNNIDETKFRKLDDLLVHIKEYMS